MEKQERLANAQALILQGGPRAIKERAFLKKVPRLTKYEEFFYTVFGELTTERGFGMKAGPIPRHAITDYADEIGLDDTEKMILLRVIRAMDRAWIDAVTAKSEASNK